MKQNIGLKLINYYSINFGLPERNKKLIKFIIIHYTGMKKESRALKKLCDPNSKVSAHYFIKNNGNVLNLVPDNYVAWHAGKSNWKKMNLLNKNSIGIEINNPGHENGYKKFSKKQFFSLKKLLKFLKKKYKIDKKNIIGHSDISPSRKKDPGEKFPWSLLAKENICLWHKLKNSELKKLRKIKISYSDQSKFLKNLYKLGYTKIKKLKVEKNNKFLATAFQRRFRQELIDGKIDKECLLISDNLVSS